MGGGAFSFNMLLSFVGDGFYSTIIQRLHLRGGQGGSYTDIYDGKLYQRQVAAGFLAEKNNISVIFNTDGVPVFRSSKFAFWPIYLLINELPYKMRYVRCTCATWDRRFFNWTSD